MTLYFHFLFSYIYFRSNFTRYFWSSDVYVIINILYRPSTCNAGSQAQGSLYLLNKLRTCLRWTEKREEKYPLFCRLARLKETWGASLGYVSDNFVRAKKIIEERSPTFFPLGSSGAAPYGVGNCLQVGWRTREKLQPLGIKNEHFVILISCLLYISSTVAGQTFFSLKNKS